MAEQLLSSGLNKLYIPHSSIQVHASIIFVHGLFGHPYSTWNRNVQSKDVFWPKDLLPEVIPSAQIFSWGYDANVDQIFSSASQNTVHQHAENLLSDLCDLQEEEGQKNIPFIFVVHSMGGIIVKDALVLSNQTEGTRVKSIFPATFAICFLGTPHRGSKTASIGKIAYRTTVALTKRPNTKLLSALERNSEVLERVSDGFVQLLQKQNIRIRSFREELETRKYLFFNTFVVEADSAKIGHGREEVGSIPASHSKMTKFKDSDDIGYKRVTTQLKRWVADCGEQASDQPLNAQEIISSFDDPVARARKYNIRNSHEATFHWLFDENVVPFKLWLRGTISSPLFWIQGKPGSGKSTLMKFALKSPIIMEELNRSTGGQWLLGSYFFHDRGSEVQKTMAGMLQELIYQILVQAPNLTSILQPLYQGFKKTGGKWTIENLQAALEQLVRTRSQICFFLDALDEHDQREMHSNQIYDNDVLAQFLRSLTTIPNTNIKICLASRSWGVFEAHFGTCPNFAIHEYTTDDIKQYTQSRFLELPTDQASSKITTNIQGAIISKARGVFIWVRIVVDDVIKGLRDGSTLVESLHTVEEMPEELEDLYHRTLTRIDPNYIQETCRMLQIALCAIHPITLSTFMSCNMLSTSQPSDWENMTEESMRRRLYSRTGGLLETFDDYDRADSVPEGDIQGCRVQFIHQSVKDFVSKSPSQDAFPEDWKVRGNIRLFECCAILMDDDINRFYFHYAQNAMIASKLNGQQSQLEDTLSILRMSFSFVALDQSGILSGRVVGSIEVEFSDKDRLTQSRIREQLSTIPEYRLSSLAIMAGLPFLPLFSPGSASQCNKFLIAATSLPAIGRPYLGKAETVKYILDQYNKEVPYRIDFELVVLSESDSKVYRPKHHIESIPFLAFLLLDDRDGFRQYPLALRLEIFDLLMTYGADPNEMIMEQDSCFHACVLREEPEIIQLFLERGADIRMLGINGLTAYEYALCRGDYQIIELLEDFGGFGRQDLIDLRHNFRRRTVHGILPGILAASLIRPELLDRWYFILRHIDSVDDEDFFQRFEIQDSAAISDEVF